MKALKRLYIVPEDISCSYWDFCKRSICFVSELIERLNAGFGIKTTVGRCYLDISALQIGDAVTFGSAQQATVAGLEILAAKHSLKVTSIDPRHTYPTHISDRRMN